MEKGIKREITVQDFRNPVAVVLGVNKRVRGMDTTKGQAVKLKSTSARNIGLFRVE